jgi:hypothetical protein
MPPRSLAEQYANKCIHFNGVMNNRCEADIAYADVRQPIEDRQPGDLAYALPCLKDRKGHATCALLQFPTAEEAIEHENKAEARIAELLGKLHDNICPHCDTPVEKQRQVGRCVYAEPCGHRLYQGKAKKQP